MRKSRLNFLRELFGLPLVYYSEPSDIGWYRIAEAEWSKAQTVNKCFSFSASYRDVAVKRAKRLAAEEASNASA